MTTTTHYIIIWRSFRVKEAMKQIWSNNYQRQTVNVVMLSNYFTESKRKVWFSFCISLLVQLSYDNLWLMLLLFRWIAALRIKHCDFGYGSWWACISFGEEQKGNDAKRFWFRNWGLLYLLIQSFLLLFRLLYPEGWWSRLEHEAFIECFCFCFFIHGRKDGVFFSFE